MKIAPMNAQDDVTAGLDITMTIMVEVPIDTFQLACGFVFGRQGIINGQEDGQRLVGDAPLEISDDEFDEGKAEVVGIPRANAEEVGEVAGIDAVEFLACEFGQGFAAWCNDEEIGEALDVSKLGRGQGEGKRADEGDNAEGAAYNGFHGSLGVKEGFFAKTNLFYARDPFSSAVNRSAISFWCQRQGYSCGFVTFLARVQYSGLSQYPIEALARRHR
jgi:hypothetical protein